MEVSLCKFPVSNGIDSCLSAEQVTRAMKVVVSRADEDMLVPALELEHSVFSSLWGSPDNATAVGAGGAKQH